LLCWLNDDKIETAFALLSRGNKIKIRRIVL